MKILHKSKKAIPPPPQLAEFIAKLVASSNEELTKTLKEVPAWKWPRSDLNAWIKVLDKFDDIMDTIIQEYNVDKLQLKPFSEETKELLAEILRFERLLLENSTNRKTFSSYDRLNCLLSTSDLDILILALNLLLRPSQQYAGGLASTLSISGSRLQSLARKWPYLRENEIGLVDLTSSQGPEIIEGIPVEARTVAFSFYRPNAPNTTDEPKSDDVFESPTKQASSGATASRSNAVQVDIDERTILAKPAMDVLADAIQEHSVPETETFELLCRIRAAGVFARGNRAEREKLVVSRLLAIAIYGHTHSGHPHLESQASSTLFMYEPDLVSHIAELLQVDRGIPTIIQTAAISALDALARYKSKVQEVLTAVNAGVNHGLLMALVRYMVTEVANPESTLPQSFVEALLSFITYIASHASGGNMLVGAGLLPVLIQIMENRSATRLQVVSKTMQLVDNLLYSFATAFGLFVNAHGVDVLVDRIEYEIDLDIKDHAVDFQECAISGSGELPIQRIAVLKHILRSMHRMMQSSGTAEGLRGLIDSSLLKSIKKVIQYRGLFGPNIFPLAINIMATFVHNEPTSLAIIQEAGLPELFYKAIEYGIEPAIEVIQAIPNAVGALCLNEVGQAQLAKRPSVIPSIFTILTSERHLKVLIDKEHAVIVGTAVDELIRHHPTLKSAVYASLRSTLTRIEDLGMAYTPPDDIKHWYSLVPVPVPEAKPADGDVPMEAVAAAEPTEAPAPSTSRAGEEEDSTSKNHDNVVVSFIDVFGRFLEGFFQHLPHCKDFVATTDCLRRYGALTGLPCLPYDFANNVSSDSMMQVLRTMTEASPNETVEYLSQSVKSSLSDTKFLWEPIEEKSKLLPFVDVNGQDVEAANHQFRSLAVLHIRMTLLSDIFSATGSAQGRVAISLLQTLMNHMPSQVLTDLGTLHRAIIWENISLKTGLASKGIDAPPAATEPPSTEGSPSPPAVELPSVEGAAPANGANGVDDNAVTPPALELATVTSQRETPKDWNASSLKHITQGLPSALGTFFQAMVKMFHARRNPDASQKKQIMDASKILANIMVAHLSVKDFENKSALFSYYSTIFSMFSMLLIDERTPTNTIHTVQVFAFYQAKGFEAVFDICNILISSIETLNSVKEEDRSAAQKNELLHAYNALKVALHFVYPLVSSKPLLESGQTQLLNTSDKAETDPDYFEAHNFLVKMRSIAVPTIRRLWEATWLVQAPIGVSRNVVRAVLEIANGENEEAKGVAVSDMGRPTGGITVTRPATVGPDESRIRLLTDMGFPRSAAERALIRTHNNVNSATEILLAHPFPFPPDPDPVPEAEAAPAEVAEAPPTEPAEASEAPAAGETDTPTSTEAVGNVEEVAAPAATGKTTEDWRKELDEAREPLRALISKQSLLLIDEHLSLLFDLHIAFTKPSAHQPQAIQALVDDVEGFLPYAYSTKEQPLANRCRLLALVLCEHPSSFDTGLRDNLMGRLLELLASSTYVDRTPKWLAAHLLVTEALFTLGDEPRAIELPKEGEETPQVPISVGATHPEAKAVVFKRCMQLLAINDLPTDEFLSVLRLIVLLTRDRDVAAQFVIQDGLVYLFQRVKNSPVAGSSSYIATILRHVVEDASTIQGIMQQSIKRYFSQPRTRIVDVSTFVRNCNAVALRDIDLFIDTTKSLCDLEQPYESPIIRLKPEAPSKDESAAPTSEGTADMQVDNLPVEQVKGAHKPAETVLHLLISELMNLKKETEQDSAADAAPRTAQVSESSTTAPSTQTEPPQPEGASTTTPAGSTPAAALSPADMQDKTLYMCFLMQCLTELLLSYDTCKTVFLSYSPKKKAQQTPGRDTHNKFRMATLQFLLSEMVTYGTLNHSPDGKLRNQSTLCNWAMNVIGALCTDTSLIPDAKDTSPELTLVRKFVLETIIRTVKDLPSMGESTEARYGRLLALADLSHRLLTVRVASTSRKPHDEIPTQVAKIMLEKNFVATFTSALSEVDLNYPNVRNVVASILRPLELLTKIAIKMSKISNKAKEDAGQDYSVSSDSASEDESMDDETREETPDLYRNSALGMYAGEMDDGQYSEGEEIDDEDDDQDVEMEYGEETGSEDTSESGSEGEDDLDHVTQDSGEGWEEGDEEDEDDLVENDDEEEQHAVDDEDAEDQDDEEEDDIDDDAIDHEAIWEDIEQEADDMGLALDQGDAEAAHGVPIQVNHEEDEPEMASDEEEYLVEHDHFMEDHGHGLGTDDPFGNLFSRAGFMFRRPRGNDSSHFGRSRNAAASAESTTHPLLLDMSAAHRGNMDRNRARPGHRLLHGAPPSNILQTLEGMLAQAPIHMIQQLMTLEQGMAGMAPMPLPIPLGMLPDGAGAFRVEIAPATAPLLAHSRRFIGAFNRTERVPRPQAGRQGREFDPLPTLQRWAEEMKILHGDFVNERVGKLVNHVILAMIPAALESIKKAEEEKAIKEKEQARIEAEKAAAEVAAVAATDASVNTSTDPQEIARSETPVEAPISATTPPSEDTHASEQDAAMADVPPTDTDEEMTDASQLAEESSPTSTSTVPIAESAGEASSSAAGTSANPPERVTVMIHGSPVDITNTGIDPTFLEALPDDMREEVLNQHVRDQQASQVNRAPDSQISSEFLDALPPDIRAEIIQQEAMERARIRNDANPRPAADAVDMDPASFIATLDPTLRQAVLLDQDEGFIRGLPAHMIAEAGAYRDEMNAGLPRMSARRPPGMRHVPQPGQVKKNPPQHDAILLLDRASVAVLVRLLFYPQVLKKNLLFKVLVNLCENAKTRIELFNILLSILQEGTADVSAVDKSFAQMTVRSRDNKTQTPKKQKTGESLAALALPTSHLEAVPELIAQRCLEALTNIVSGNELSSLFFLTEHELPVGLRKAASKKGKGKEKQSQTHYPLVLLLNLLDRPSLLRTPSILESVVGLLASVTRPLTSLKNQTKQDVDKLATTSAGTAPQDAASTAVSSTNPTGAPAGTSNEPTSDASAQPTASSGVPGSSTDNPQPIKSADQTADAEKPLLSHPPQVPESALRLIVNILTMGECSGRTFQQCLALIQHLSNIPDSRDVIANELKARAQEFGQTLYSDLDELASALQNNPSMVSSVAAKFSPASSTQAKLLRVLKTIDYMYTPKNYSPSTPSTSADSEDVEKVQAIYESFRFTPLWKKLGDCLAIIGENSELSHVSTVLLPLIESLMVVCKFVGSKNTAPILRALRSSSSPLSPTTPRESMEELFISFTDAHRKILNLMVRNNPSLMSGSFSLLVNNSRVLDFDNKRNYFNQQLHKRPHTREHYGTLQLNIRRARVFEDSFLYLQRKTGEQIKHGKLSVRFYDEEGVDAGGLTREWFQILARQMFNPNNALFQPCAADKLTYQPNKNSWVNPEHLSFFKFVGRIIGKAIYDGRLLDAYFARSLYRQLLGKPVDYRDVEWVDPEYYKSLCWILENDPTVLDMNFSVEADEFGVNRIVPLKEGGESIPVTQENKREFVQLSAQYRLYSSIKEQIEKLSEGFYEIIPKDLITIFNEQELELLISGTPDIDVDEWRAATEYNGYTSSDPNIVWWWRALKSFNREERAKVLSFATGTSRVPLSGFLDLQGVQGVQKFSIHRAYGAPDRLPQAHTCFNQIDLPQYTSYEMLRQQLLLAIHEGGEGFAFS